MEKSTFRIRSACWAIFMCALLAACGATEVKTVNLGPHVLPEDLGPEPFEPQQYEVSVGDVMMVSRMDGAVVTNQKYKTFEVSGDSTASVKHRNNSFLFLIPQGHYLLRGKNVDGRFFESPISFSPLNGDTKEGFGGLFVPDGSSVATMLYWHWGPNIPSVYWAPLKAPIEGKFGELVFKGDEDFGASEVATLTYAGVFAGQIRFVYKEFTDRGMARPAFTQDVTLDYKPGGSYSYKDARFIVERADSTTIRFVLQHPLFRKAR